MTTIREKRKKFGEELKEPKRPCTTASGFKVKQCEGAGTKKVHGNESRQRSDSPAGDDNLDNQRLLLKSTEETGKSWLSRKEQKRLTTERKQAKPIGNVIQRSKRIWEQLRRKQTTPAERLRLIEELQVLIKGHIKDLVFKHDASRVVQTALKYGKKAVRTDIIIELKGTYVDLAQSSYGKYLVVKAMHYGAPETKEQVVEEFCGHVKRLIRHREASFVIEDCYREYGTPEQKARLLREFYGLEFSIFGKGDNDSNSSLARILEASPEKRPVIMKNLFGTLAATVEKGTLFFSIVHGAMLQFLLNTSPGTTEAAEFIGLVKERVGEIAFTKDGAQVVMRCLALGDAKDRKVILKSLKPVVDTLAAHEFGHIVLLTALDVVDDTVLVSKLIFEVLQKHLSDLLVHKFGRIPLLYPFAGRKVGTLQPSAVALLDEMDKVREFTSKKDPALRQSELRKHLSPAALQGVVDHANALVYDSFGCAFITAVLLAATGDKTAALDKIAELSGEGDPMSGKPAGDDGDADATHFAATAAGARMLKTLVAGGYYNHKIKEVEVARPPLNFHDVLFSKIRSKVKQWAVGSTSFVLVALLEAKGFSEKDTLKGQLKEFSKDVQAASSNGNKGCQMILNAINR